MSNSWFQFKQFLIKQDKCAMKVGTDGVLLGAWADISNTNNVLDVGTGTGLIALMIAQRCPAHITGVELDIIATKQARENVEMSSWKERINIINEDYRNWQSTIKFDLIVSNPPYFIESLKSPDKNRTNARHTDCLSYEELIGKSATLLTQDGVISLIIPTAVENTIKDIAEQNSLYPIRQTYVFTKPEVPSKRTLISLSPQYRKCETSELIIELSRHNYSEEFKELTRSYYLK